MSYQYQGLLDMLTNYEKDHGLKPSIIVLGKTHLEDLQNYFQVETDELYFDGIEVIQHNDPIGILMAHDGRKYLFSQK